jgi:membrane protein DedA with SNARE-associated domain
VTGLSHLGVSSLISYFVAVLLPAFDALIPLLPSETAVIALGVATADSTDPRAAVLVALAAAGAFLGDNAAYLLGRHFGPAAARRVFAGERGMRRRAWAERSLHQFGARIIIGCRFIPGGRTAITLTCGLVGYPRRRFIVATAVAAVIWASYAFFIGRLGGNAFEDRPWAGLLLALGLTVVISVLIEAARRAWSWRRRRHERARVLEHADTQEHRQSSEGADAQEHARTPEWADAQEHASAPLHTTAALGLTRQTDGR